MIKIISEQEAREQGSGQGRREKVYYCFLSAKTLGCLLSSSRRCLSIFYGQQFREG